MTHFYLSFVDPALPKGKRFVGATVVEAARAERGGSRDSRTLRRRLTWSESVRNTKRR